MHQGVLNNYVFLKNPSFAFLTIGNLTRAQNILCEENQISDQRSCFFAMEYITIMKL